MVAELEDDSASGQRIDCPVLVTERLVLRQPCADDVPDLASLANDRRIAEMLARMPHPYGEAEAKAFVAMAARRKAESSPGCIYAVSEAETGRLLGCAGLEPRDGGFELGYWIGAPYWGRGYATETAHALVDLAFRATEVDVLTVSCRVINPVSRRVIHKCGFQYAGQGMIDSLVAGRVAVERYRLDRRTWIGLRSWPRARS